MYGNHARRVCILFRTPHAAAERNSMNKVWLITGTSTGFGRDLAEAALEAGDLVAATARKPETLSALQDKHGDSVLPLRLDVTDSGSIAQAVQAVHAKWGRIDVLVNNAGNGVFGALEEITDAQLRAQYDTNVFGLAAVTRAVLPIMRAQKAGRILNVSSVAGLVGMPGMTAYGSSKFAVEGLSEGLAAEVEPLGIHVTIVEPGGFNTAFGSSGVPIGDNPALEDYAQTAGATVGWLKSALGSQPGDPKKAAQAMLRVANDPNPPLRLLLGSDAWGMLQGRMDSFHQNLQAQKSVTLSTDFAA